MAIKSNVLLCSIILVFIVMFTSPKMVAGFGCEYTVRRPDVESCSMCKDACNETLAEVLFGICRSDITCAEAPQVTDKCEDNRCWCCFDSRY
ncbi:hypothetical protein MKW92_032664 [Papaver armeniacum]|nr:hypothetical protein MKW92_032664 [Papaver armeniacum]